MSFRDIGTVTRTADGEYDQISFQSKIHTINKSKDSQALDLFSQGKKPIEVTVALDLKVLDVERTILGYLDSGN